ncbi:hypothetical protein ACFPPD_01115 [Cohnella suwonensis]|uniref:Response regulatory domain-containing protein n=1 Tax=Cohnella suwonensis TaxID=696072 RepID=A0ABW0LNL7_9BACL
MMKLVDWHALGLTIIGEVYKGDELLNAIMEHSPDIVISDIADAE